MSVQANPETIFNDLLQKALDVVVYGFDSEFQRKALERDAASLARVDASGSFEVQGHLAAAANDDDRTDTFFEKALKASDDVQGTVVRYIIVLAGVGRGDKALEVFENYQNLFKGNPNAIRTLSENLGVCGWFKIEQELDSQVSRIGGDNSNPRIQYGSQAFDPMGLAEREFSEPICFARRFLRSKRFSGSASRRSLVPGDRGQASIFYELYVEADAEAVIELEWSLMEAIGEANFQSLESGLLVIGLVAKESAKDADMSR